MRSNLHTLMKTKPQSGKKTQSQTLRIEFHDEHAQAVSIAGTFNDCRPGVAPMIPLGQGRWVKELALPPGRFEFRLIVDGRWICDPAATEKVPNPHSGHNAAIIAPPVEAPARRAS